MIIIILHFVVVKCC